MCLTAGHGLKFARIAERHPQLTLIVDHMGVSTAIVKAGKTAESIGDAVALAKYPNVSVKLSAAPNYSSEPYPFRDFLPHIRVLFDAYGPQRCYWGTDLTNGFSKATYRQRDHALHRGDDFSLRERQGLDHGARDPQAPELGLK
jgi:predicted TIM-barrel fold metal-dependent hydrolase